MPSTATMPRSDADGAECIDVTRFLADPSEVLAQSHTRMASVPRAELDALQLAALQQRYAQFREKLPMLKRFADNQSICAVERLDDVLPLLFDHATYKSYPASLLDKNRFDLLTGWLAKLTTVDLSAFDARQVRSVDEWMQKLRDETPLSICHTSGTTGSFSFLPWSKREWRVMTAQFTMQFFRRFGEDGPPLPLPHNLHCIYPFFRRGGMMHTIVNDYFAEFVAGDESRFHAAYPGYLSADLMLLAARHRAAQGKGETLTISPELDARREEFEVQQRGMPRYLAEFSSQQVEALAGQRIFIMATSPLLLAMAERGLAQGQRRVFAPDSVIITGGGGKGLMLPDGWIDRVKDFLGVDHVNMGYGMSEMSAAFPICEHGHYHATPWIIPFILDPDTNQPLPRSGTVTGRFAFYDLMPDTRWGGFITGDEVTMTWDPVCPCGRSSAYLHGNIQRLSQRAKHADGEEKLSCADTAGVYEEALDFLNGDLQ